MSTSILSPLVAAPRFVASPHAENLGIIREPGVNLCLWERAPDPGVTPLLDALAEGGQSFAIDTTVPAGANPAAALLAASPLLRGRASEPPLHAWLRDVSLLTALFLRIARCAAVRIRLETVHDPACAVFHADTLPLRLLCTYRGPGTQWLDEPNTCRGELGLNGRTIDEANAAIVGDPARIRTAPAWHVMIFKGRLWPGDEHLPLVHRSFPVCCREHGRIRLVLDPIESAASLN